VGDRRYHAALQALVDREAHRPDVAVEIARLAVPPTTPETPASELAARSGLALLASLESLRPLYPEANDDAGVLLRFAQDLLRELRDWVRDGLFDPNGIHASLRPPYAGPVGWLMAPRVPAPAQDRLWFDPARVQAGIADPLQGAAYGCLGLFAVADRARVLSWLETVPVTPGNVTALPEGDNDHYLTLALTFAGLRAIGVPAWRLKRLPQEFTDGMEARASVLGDVRVNHPEQRTRPRMADGTVLDLRLVHLTVQLRTGARPDETEACVHPRLRQALARLRAHGLILLATQDMTSRADASQVPRGHLGFADGISQPRLADDPVPKVYGSDTVRPGELFSGHRNARDRQPAEAIDGDSVDLLMDDGSFVVVRKLRQHLERMHARLEQQARAALPPAIPASRHSPRRTCS
jgi:deferrochelatase/peroxidase EfeB